jgi:hypothetical protein
MQNTVRKRHSILNKDLTIISLEKKKAKNIQTNIQHNYLLGTTN